MKDNSLFFVDTNILVYAYEKDGASKNAKCRKIIEKCFKGELELCVSNQVLAELASVLKYKLKKPLPDEDIREIIEEINRTESWRKINYTNSTVEKALQNKSSFWDSLIGETMKENNILTIYTENTGDFKQIDGIIAINPLNS